MTPVEICNLGLTAAKAKLISSLDDDTAEGRAAKTWYAPLRDLVLGDRVWSFAKAQYILATPVVPPPSFGWENKFLLPSEIIRVHRVTADPSTPDVQCSYDVQGRHIFTDETVVYVTAVKQIEDTTFFSPAFCMALGLRLGSAFAIPFSGSRQLREDLLVEYLATLKDAAGTDGSQGRSEIVRSDYLAKRRY